MLKEDNDTTNDSSSMSSEDDKGNKIITAGDLLQARKNRFSLNTGLKDNKSKQAERITPKLEAFLL